MTYKTDVKFFQSFCRRYMNRIIRLHFSDLGTIQETDLSLESPRQATKKLLLHQTDDPLLLTVGRLLFWWFETKGLLNEYIYGIPASSFHESVVYQPQIKLYWRESTEDARTSGRYPIRAIYSVRYRGDFDSRNDLELLRTKLTRIFNNPTTHNFWKGREKYSYRDKIKGYELIVTARDETEAKSVINSLLEIQDDNPLDEALLTRSTKDKDWNARETIRVAGETFTKPKERPIGRVYFTHAEFHVHGMIKPKTLISNLGERVPTRLV